MGSAAILRMLRNEDDRPSHGRAGTSGELALIGLGLAGGVLLSELLARVVFPDAGDQGPPAIFASSPVIPFTTKPNAEHLAIRARREC